jgi:hypothetical protein
MHHVSFSTEFEDMTRIETTVRGQPRVTRRTGLREGSVRLDRVESPRRLYDIHEASLAHFAANEPRRWCEDESIEGRLLASFARRMTSLCRLGYYWLDTEKAAYRPTWKGAILMTWHRRWPGRAILHVSRWWETQSVLRKIGMNQAVGRSRHRTAQKPASGP